MTEEELKQKCKERAKIFQQAMESCHSSSPIDCIEWFADRIAELGKKNAELKSIADFQTTSNMDRYFQLKRIKEQLSKATELLERLLITSCNSDVLSLLPNCSEVLKVRVEAEQFLSEVEE